MPVFDIICAPLFRNCDVQIGSYLAANSEAVFQKCMNLNPRFANDSAALGPFVWSIPPAASSGKCLIGVIAYDSSGNAGWGVSDSLFSVRPKTPFAGIENLG